MSKESLIREIKSYGKGFLKNASSIERRMQALAEIEFAAQEAREALEGALDDLDEKRTPIGFGYHKCGMPFFSESEDYADQNSTCRITALYDDEDKANYLAGSQSLETRAFG
ncbi:hypothetical protein [Stutzerimonas stutzeri]|uniref:hypothetical protein n=1 Tax=Stutzerimonas stutzeri TaxID=316 RepID=UPI0015E32C83|nr:hypothetical protein [Stutzerimonas stutzeri]MBA1280291.1 hypothetical protein [Stutzerimonas stutzeri]